MARPLRQELFFAASLMQWCKYFWGLIYLISNQNMHESELNFLVRHNVINQLGLIIFLCDYVRTTPHEKYIEMPFLNFKFYGSLYIYPQSTYLLICPHNALVSLMSPIWSLSPGSGLVSEVFIYWIQWYDKQFMIAQYGRNSYAYTHIYIFLAGYKVQLQVKFNLNIYFYGLSHILGIHAGF